MSPKEVHGLQALAMAHGGSLTINPETGLPEAGFLQDILPAVAGFALNAFAPGVGTAVGSLFGLGGAAGTALTVGGIAGLASGSLEKGIMAGMGAYGGAGLGGSLGDMGSAVNARAANEAAQVAGLGDAERVAAIQAAAKPDISAGFSAAASAPKDFLQDNKYLLGAAFLPALAGGFGDDGEGTGAPARKKYNMKYARDPVTGALYDTSGEGVTYGGVGRPTIGMAEGGPVDNRSDSEKSYDYLMGVPGAKNPMLFTHESTSAIKPADFATRKGGHYVLDAATNTYVWVPDAEDANAAAASLAAKEGLAALDRRGGGGGRDVDPTGNNPGGVNTNKGLIADILSSATLGRVLNALGTTQPPAPSEDRTPVPVGISKALDTLAPLDPFGDIGAPIGKTLNTDPQQRAAEARDVAQAQAQAQAQAAAEGYSVNAQNAVAKNSNVTDPAQMMQAKEAATGNVGVDTSGRSDGPNGPEGRGEPGGDRGGWGRGGGYAHGGIAALAGGGLGSLGGYSDGGRLLRGPGDGVSDSIPASIGNKRPARLADGEFVIPARIVSELGNGSTDAGARELYKMMARIQAGRAKTVGKNKTAVNSKSARHLPA
jgi:hypothetical protein